MNYSDFLEVEDFPSEINPNSIKAMEAEDPNWWLETYPHETFVEALEATEAMLARQNPDNKKSLWIHGSYGTGKSRIVATLKKLLECSKEDFNKYFDKYPDELGSKQDLRAKLLAQRSSGKIVIAYKYISSEINDFTDFIMTIYEEVSKSLKKAGVPYAGENTLRGGIVSWLGEESHKNFFNTLIKEPKYSSGSFAGMTADDILTKLQNPNANVHELVRDILAMAKNEGISAFSKKVEDVKAWLEDVIDRNNLKSIIFFWDEFSEFFRKNRNYLDAFQTFNELSNDKPFNMVIVTHTAMFGENDSDGRKVLDRFKRLKIELPDTIAFDLIKHVIKVKDTQKNIWNTKIATIQDDVTDATNEVAKYVWKNKWRDGVKKLNGILPIHPLAALLLKHISEKFASNQRSMFNFIKNNDSNGLEAFQWFINTHSPDVSDNLRQDDSLLTIDHLWNFFYEEGTDEHTTAAGRSNLDTQIRSILDSYAQNENRNLDSNQKRVLKTVLMLQAMSVKTGRTVPLFCPTEENIELAYNGLKWHRGDVKGIVQRLATDGILFKSVVNGKNEFAAMTVSADMEKIERKKEELRGNVDTDKLINAGEGAEKISLTAVSLTKAQDFRFVQFPLTWASFTADVNKISQNTVPGKTMNPYQIPLVLLFAQTPEERAKLKSSLKEKLADVENNENIVFIDLTAANLIDDQFEQYLEYEAQSACCQSTDSSQARDCHRRAMSILKDWKNNITNAAKTVYTCEKPDGVNCQSLKELQDALNDVVLRRYPKSFDNMKFTDQTWINSQLKNSVKLGIDQQYGQVIPKSLPDFIQNNSTSFEALKIELDNYIQEQLRTEGRVAIADVWDVLQEKGFMPCNAYAYLTGWLLRDYADVKYRTSDGEPDNSKRMNKESLTAIVFECAKDKYSHDVRYKDRYIEILSPEQKAFVDLAHNVWEDISDDLSVETVTGEIRRKLKNLGYPLWSIKEELDCQGSDEFLNNLALLANVRNDDERANTESSFVARLGKMAQQNPGIAQILKSLLTPDNAEDAMLKFLKHFEDGKLLQLADELHVDNVVYDVKRAFNGNGLWLWDQATGEEVVIRKLIDKYRFVAISNNLLSNNALSYNEALNNWDEKIRAIRIPYYTISQKCPAVKDMLKFFFDRYDNELADNRIRDLVDALERSSHAFRDFETQLIPVFKDAFSFQLNDLSDEDVVRLYSELPEDTFYKTFPKTQQLINEKVQSIKEGQLYFKLQKLWKEKTGTDTPRAWSEKYRTPILAMVPSSEMTRARQAFDAVNNQWRPDPVAVQNAINYLMGNPGYLGNLNDQARIDEAFMTKIVKKYGSLLDNADEVREKLMQKSTNCYTWLGDPEVSDYVDQMGTSRYNEQGLTKVQEKVEQMNDQQVKDLLMWLVKNSPETGIRILTDYKG